MGSLGIPDAVLASARQVTDRIGRAAADLGGALTVDADEILTGRAAMLGIAPAGRISAGGATRLLATRDGWCALTLSRADDVAAVPALLESADQPADVWAELEIEAALRDTAEFVGRARLLDLPAAKLSETSAVPPRFRLRGPRAARPLSHLLVADLSSMWAGPLCGHLLAAAGATVVKVESRERPDGTRLGDRRFYDWMNASKLSYATDFDDPELRRLLEAADVVIESSRPTALARRGLGAEQLPARPGRVWLRITGYGPEGERAQRVAFGDDAAVAGGLVGAGPAFVGDAVADPLTGLTAAQSVLEALQRGGGEIIDVALAEVAAYYAAAGAAPSPVPEDVEPPKVPGPPSRPAAELGADNARVRDLVQDRLAPC
ncbi:CoA transferase [Mycolicibacterium agri]|nr:CoA transferase [Mycolicibacterium agri]